jgi:hypothetical protein
MGSFGVGMGVMVSIPIEEVRTDARYPRKDVWFQIVLTLDGL